MPDSQFTDLIAIVGLPRSGTTLCASVLNAHPAATVCFEPWNRDSENRITTDITPEEMISKFGLKNDPGANIFVVKETAVELEAIHWLRQFLRNNAEGRRVRVVWSLRNYRHTYLSFVQGAKEWWGFSEMTVEAEAYSRWVNRATRGTAILRELYDEYPGVVFSYEALSRQAETLIPRLMEGLGIEHAEEQLSYWKFLPPNQAHGDHKLASDPQPITGESVERREEEWRRHEQALSGSSGNKGREILDRFWLEIDKCCVHDGPLPDLDEELDMALSPEPQVRGSALGHEYRVELSSKRDWNKFARGNPAIFNADQINECALHIRRQGFRFRGEDVPGTALGSAGENYREGFVHREINSRKRAVAAELWRDIGERGLAADTVKVYAPEALGGFANYMQSEFPFYSGSEYIPDPAAQRRLSPVEHQDLSCLSYPDQAFDYVLVNDIFEHVPDLHSVIKEIQRVLAPGGALLSTFPFAIKQDEHLVKACLQGDGSIEYLSEPEYHEDPVDKKGALVYQVPGWAILADCLNAGFDDATMVFLCSPARGILSNNISGITILKARKPG